MRAVRGSPAAGPACALAPTTSSSEARCTVVCSSQGPSRRPHALKPLPGRLSHAMRACRVALSCASDWICGLSRMRRSAHCTSQAPLAPLLTGWISEGLPPSPAPSPCCASAVPPSFSAPVIASRLPSPQHPRSGDNDISLSATARTAVEERSAGGSLTRRAHFM